PRGALRRGGAGRPYVAPNRAQDPGGAPPPPDSTEAEVRAAEDEAPLPDDGGAQDDGLEADFSDPQP
ncbi:hypothetical protein ACI8AV_22680, partial [Geodermatophilus sp. SYSU D00804]